jgi:hypothetical protein
MPLIVYYEVPTEDKRDEVKQRFDSLTNNQMVLQSS